MTNPKPDLKRDFHYESFQVNIQKYSDYLND